MYAEKRPVRTDWSFFACRYFSTHDTLSGFSVACTFVGLSDVLVQGCTVRRADLWYRGTVCHIRSRA